MLSDGQISGRIYLYTRSFSDGNCRDNGFFFRLSKGYPGLHILLRRNIGITTRFRFVFRLFPVSGSLSTPQRFDRSSPGTLLLPPSPSEGSRSSRNRHGEGFAPAHNALCRIRSGTAISAPFWVWIVTDAMIWLIPATIAAVAGFVAKRRLSKKEKTK